MLYPVEFAALCKALDRYPQACVVDMVEEIPHRFAHNPVAQTPGRVTPFAIIRRVIAKAVHGSVENPAQ